MLKQFEPQKKGLAITSGKALLLAIDKRLAKVLEEECHIEPLKTFLERTTGTQQPSFKRSNVRRAKLPRFPLFDFVVSGAVRVATL